MTPSPSNDERIARLDDNGTPKLIFINMGTNDCFFNDMGSVPTSIDVNDLEQLDQTKFYPAMYTTVRKIQTAYPNATIIGIIPKWCDGEVDFIKYKNTCEAIKETYAALAIPTIDLRFCGINSSNIGSLTIDGHIHPNKLGMKYIARYIVEQTLNLNLQSASDK